MDDIMLDSDDQNQLLLSGTQYIKKQYLDITIPEEKPLPTVAASNSFYFPDKQFSLMVWKSVEELSAWLKQEEEIKYGRRLYQIDPYKQLSVYYWCRLCKAKMIFKKTKAGLVIHKFENHHTHLTTRRQVLSAARKLVQKKLNESCIQQIKLILTKQFKFNMQTAQGVIDQVIAASPLQGIQKILLHKGYELRYQGEDRAMPDVLLAISGSMKEACQMWGDQVSFHLMTDLLKHKKGSKNYLAGTFTGLASDMDMVIFGSCVMVVDTKESFCSLFKSFFEVTGKEPDALITDDRPEIGQAIKQLQQQGSFKGTHILDPFQILKTLQKQTTYDRFPYYKKLFLTRYDYKYQSILKKIGSIEGGKMADSSVMEVPQLSSGEEDNGNGNGNGNGEGRNEERKEREVDMEIDEEDQQDEEEAGDKDSRVEEVRFRDSNLSSNPRSSNVQQIKPPQFLPYILSRCHQLCFSQMPISFVGFSTLINRHQNFTKILLHKVQFASTARKFFSRIDTLQSKMLNKCIKVYVSSEYYQRKFSDPKLKDVRVKVGRKLIDKFICLYVEGLVDTVAGGFGMWTVTDPNRAEFRVKLQGEAGEAMCRCECGYYERMGLPCEHMIAVIKNVPEMSYVSHIHQRWISEGFFKRQPKLGPGRRSGRRLMRY